MAWHDTKTSASPEAEVFVLSLAGRTGGLSIGSPPHSGTGRSPVPLVRLQSGVPRRRKRRSSGARFSCPGAALLLLRFRGQTLRWFARGGGRGMRIFLCFTGSRGFCFTARRANQRPFETAAAPGRSFTAAPNNPGGHTGSGGSARCLQ